MKVLLRADASPTQGTGHVMRCLTLAEALRRAGHEVRVATNHSGVDWLENLISRQDVSVERVPQHSLSSDLIAAFRPDWLVVDSYEIDAALISQARASTKVLAIVDGDDRSIDADVYVDHNIGAEKLAWPDSVRPRLLAGSRYALIRQAVLDVRRNAPWELATDVPHVVAVMGGSDPTGMIVPVASALARASTSLSATIVCAPAWRTRVDAIVAGHTGLHVVPPTNDLPALLGTADIAVSAAGTSSWELCTLGIPSVLVEVVDNQTEGLRAMTAQGLVIGISPRLMTSTELEVSLRESLDSLCTDAGKRRELSQRCLDEFDGRGAERVVTAMERATSDTAQS